MGCIELAYKVFLVIQKQLSFMIFIHFVFQFYKVKDSDDIIVATQITQNRPFCYNCSHLQQAEPNIECEHCEAKVPLPPPHFQRTVCLQWKDPNETKDHVWQDEVNQHFEFQVDGEWKDIGMPEIAAMGGTEDITEH